MDVHVDEARIKQKIENLHDLPVVPEILKRMQVLCDDQNVSIRDIGRFLSQDPSLSSKVMRAVNSPFYGFPGRISTINHALVLLGLNFLKGLIIGLSVADSMERMIPGLWKHSAGSAVIARIISARVHITEPEEVTTGCLLHDIGKIALYAFFPSDYKKCLARSKNESVSLRQAERDAFHVDHALVSSWLTEKWKFPSILAEQIAYHHEPEHAPNFPVHTAIVHLSDVLIRKRSFGFSGDCHIPKINRGIYEILNMREKDIDGIVGEAKGQLDDVERFLGEN